MRRESGAVLRHPAIRGLARRPVSQRQGPAIVHVTLSNRKLIALVVVGLERDFFQVCVVGAGARCSDRRFGRRHAQSGRQRMIGRAVHGIRASSGLSADHVDRFAIGVPHAAQAHGAVAAGVEEFGPSRRRPSGSSAPPLPSRLARL